MPGHTFQFLWIIFQCQYQTNLVVVIQQTAMLLTGLVTQALPTIYVNDLTFKQFTLNILISKLNMQKDS